MNASHLLRRLSLVLYLSLPAVSVLAQAQATKPFEPQYGQPGKDVEWVPTPQALGPCAEWCTALLWIVPAKVGGTWATAQGDLTLTQQFQMVSGTLGSGAIMSGRLHGDRISFSVGEALFLGRVNGNRIEGRVTSGGRTNDLVATRTGR